MKKGNATFKILDILDESLFTFGDLFMAIMRAGYGASYHKLEYEFQKESSRRLKGKDLLETRTKFSNLLYKLKKDGLIKDDKKRHTFSITAAGREKLSFLKHRKLPASLYVQKSSSTFTIVAFDIFEKERRKRHWLREVLKNMGLKMIQKSVWMGKVELPQEFLHDLQELNLLDCVEIFQITKTGSLRQVS